MTRTLLLATSAFAIIATSPWLAAAHPAPGTVYTIGGANGFVMDDDASSSSQGTPIIQWAPNGGINQQWALTASGSGYELVNQSSGLCLNVAAASKANGGHLIQWACNGQSNEVFTLKASGSGSGYELVAANSGKCVTEPNSSEGSQLEQETCKAASAQVWTFTDPASSSSSSSSGTTTTTTTTTGSSSSSSSGCGQGQILWGANGHEDQGGPYTSIPLSTQLANLHAVIGSGTVLYRNFADSLTASAAAPDVTAAQAASGQPILDILTYPNWSSFSSQQNAYNWAYSQAEAWAQATPTAQYYEIGNEWDLNGINYSGSAPANSPSQWTSSQYYPMAVAVEAGAIAAIRQYSPKAKIIGGSSSVANGFGLPQAIQQGLQSQYPGLMWDYTVLHYYMDVGNGMPVPSQNNWGGGNNIYEALGLVGVPIAVTEFGSSDQNDSSDVSAASQNITAMMQDFENNAAPSATSPGIVLATIYQMYQQPGIQTDYDLYTYSSGSSATLAPQGQAVQAWVAGPGAGGTCP